MSAGDREGLAVEAAADVLINDGLNAVLPDALLCLAAHLCVELL